MQTHQIKGPLNPMNNEKQITLAPKLERMECNSVDDLLNRLPELAKTIITDNADNKNFGENPDDPKEHTPFWHQFGIITHTKKLIEFYHTEASGLLSSGNLTDKIQEHLAEKIDGKSKADLLEISMVLHDIGKFACDDFFRNEDGEIIVRDFRNHEVKSKDLILNNQDIQQILKQGFQLTNNQIQYIADCAGLHFQLGDMREEAKQSDHGYSMQSSKSDECKTACSKIASSYSKYQYEIGIFFLTDSLAKTDVIIDGAADNEIINKEEWIKNEIRTRNLNYNLLGAIKQRPINIEIAKTYLENLAD